MAASQIHDVVQHLRRTVLRDGAGLTDGQLLESYISRRDEAALSSLVLRHGPMVWGVCRRVLHSHHDAEDAFQATFLVLVRRARSIHPRHMLPNWLYGVAHQTALNARAAAARRRGRERQVAPMPEPAVTEPPVWRDLQPILDEELARLPDKYRNVVVLCDLESKTRKEAARQIGVPEGTVAGWLARARVMLAKRLARRGVALSGGALATVLSEGAASAEVPASVMTATLKAAATGATSLTVTALAQGVTKAMLLTKLRAIAVLVLGFLAGAAVLASQSSAGPDDTPIAVPTPKPEKGADPFTAWGEEVGGLQAGLGFPLGEHRIYRHGQTAKLVVRVRNVGKEHATFQYLRHFFIENPPVVLDEDGNRVPFKDGAARGIYKPMDVSLAPGKEIELHELQLELSNNLGVGVPKDSTLGGTGKFSVQYPRVLGSSSLSSAPIKYDPILNKLATGKLTLEVKPADRKPAWGEPVGGLRAGLSLGDKRRKYRHGETITLFVHVRNVSKEPVKFDYIRQFLDEEPPTVTNADGKAVPQGKTEVTGLIHVPVQVSLAPGKEIVLESRIHGASGLPYELRPTKGGGKATKGSTLFVDTGKVSLQYERVFGNTSAGRSNLDPALAKLATGKLELEVEPPADDKNDDGFTAW